ncbi:MAG TPA: 4a-hydroxytetrahydrobiopterin dehydratase [Verrucomicrobiae bacterium]|nr:4a-hydroxytetrahydrobiopterin dehydratase [Verrucomicrobiae bacterium]
MRMKPFSANRKTPSRTTARNAAIVNQLATPGLGSLMARRWLEGIGQLILFLTGFVIFIIWFVKQMVQYYGQITGNVPTQSIGWILETGATICAIAWLWAAVTSFSLIRAASNDRLKALENFAAPPVQKLEAAQIPPMFATVPNWQRNGEIISRTFQFKDFPEAIKFVNAVSEIAEREWHHPDIDIRWNKVTLALTTHDAGGLTEKDFKLARQFDALLPR